MDEGFAKEAFDGALGARFFTFLQSEKTVQEAVIAQAQAGTAEVSSANLKHAFSREDIIQAETGRILRKPPTPENKPRGAVTYPSNESARQQAEINVEGNHQKFIKQIVDHHVEQIDRHLGLVSEKAAAREPAKESAAAVTVRGEDGQTKTWTKDQLDHYARTNEISRQELENVADAGRRIT